MPTKEQLERLHREDLERLKGFCLMDDDFMTQCFADHIGDSGSESGGVTDTGFRGEHTQTLGAVRCCSDG